MGSENICGTDLTLGLAFSSSSQNQQLTTKWSPNTKKNPPAANKFMWSTVVDPSLNLSLSFDHSKVGNDRSSDLYGQDSSASSYLSNACAAKRDRETSCVVKAEAADRVCSKKKQRLSKPQSSLLEETFKKNTTLNSKQKQHLARELNLKPRQVEVWFQNRRARTKLKLIEADYDLLKKCCEKLTDENVRLQKEVQQLKALKLTKPSLNMRLPEAAVAPPAIKQITCPSCERVAGTGAIGRKTTRKSSFTMVWNTHFYNPVSGPSTA